MVVKISKKHKQSKKNVLTKGEIGERLVSNFCDQNLSKIFSFPNPKNKDNAEIADVLIWLNRTVFLIEVKTRSSEGTAPIESWFHSQIKKAHSQIVKSYERIQSKEKIYLRNDYYHPELDCDDISRVVGLIVMVYEDNCTSMPTEHFSDIYDSELPIHVLSWKNLEKMVEEIDTVPDLNYYLQDRYEYLAISDIPLEQELDVLSYYKSKSNSFPDAPTDFALSQAKYKASMKSQIQARDTHNKNSTWIDNLEELFLLNRKLLDGIPIGLYFAWELGALSRRERAYYGEKLNRVQKWFNKGNLSRQFSWQNSSTGNWLLFYFSKEDERNSHESLIRLAQLKVIKEIELNAFQHGVYAVAFSVSNTYPHQLLGVSSSVLMGTDIDYTDKDIEAAFNELGRESGYSEVKVVEFPDDWR
jgi:hypothetical protein